MLADRGPSGSTRFRECRDVRFSAGQSMEQGEAGPVAQEGEEFRRERELVLVRGTRMRIMCR